MKFINKYNITKNIVPNQKPKYINNLPLLY